MIIAFSTTSPVASVAILTPTGEILFHQEQQIQQNASAACLRMLEQGLAQLQRPLKNATLFAADLGPGSFIGVRVSVTLAKTLAYANGAKTIGATAFDLISPTQTVVLPSKKGEYFVREPGQEPYRTTEPPQAIGYGTSLSEQTYPKAANFASLLTEIQPIAPELLLPEYLIEPSISTPKKPYAQKP